MGENMNSTSFQNNTNNIIIYNTIRKLGLRPNHSGTIFIVKAVQLVQKYSDIVIINDIYLELSKTSEKFTPSQIRVAIKYAIDNRNEEKSIKNFKEVFGYDYDEEIFKNLIKENAQKARTNVRVFFNNKYYNLFLQKFYLFYKYLLKILHLYYFLLFDNIVL